MPEIKTTLILDLKVTMTVSVELQVEASRTGNIIKCSEKVIASCNLLLNMIDVTESKDNLPIKMPPFITKMHILDLLETTELGHCRLLMAHSPTSSTSPELWITSVVTSSSLKLRLRSSR